MKRLPKPARLTAASTVREQTGQAPRATRSTPKGSLPGRSGSGKSPLAKTFEKGKK